MEKKCFKCGEVKSLSEFYKHPRMADGHLNKCKECAKKDVRKNRKQNVSYYREYDRARGNRQQPGYNDEYKQRFPGKHKAHRAVEMAVRSGKMRRESHCEKCGSSDAVHAHHDDYAFPLTVRWLCAACHHEWHAEHGEAPNGS